jgi:predicted transcriptional regulator
MLLTTTPSEFDEINEWQVREIGAGIDEANAGDFADDADVTALTNKWAARGS